jgi:tricorn protease
MKRILTTAIFLSFFFFLNVIAQDNSPFVRYPGLNSDGTKIAFSFQGDIWLVPSTGGTATRLTIHEAYDGIPKWSPDNKMIAFSSDRYGNNDIFVIPSGGGIPKRMTYFSANDVLSDWASNGDLLFESSRGYKQI